MLGITLAVATPLLAAILVATTFFAASVLADTLLDWEGEHMSFESPEVSIVKKSSEKWSGNAALKYTGVAAPQYSVSGLSEAGSYSMTIRGKAKTDPAAPDAWPIVEVYRNNIWDPANKIATLTIDATTLADYTVSGTIPQNTTKILVKATGNMAGDQVFWLDKVSLKHTPSPDTTPPQTTMDSGPGSASTTYNGDPSFSFSSSDPIAPSSASSIAASGPYARRPRATRGSPTASTPSLFGRSTEPATRTPRPRPEGGGYGNAAGNISSPGMIWTR
jgi:hypothetical protein